MHGDGVRKWGNGAVLDGNFVRGVATGKGKFHFPNGDSYEGEFKHD